MTQHMFHLISPHPVHSSTPLLQQVSVGSYIVGEFGHLIANDPKSSPAKQLEALQLHYPMVSLATRGLILSTYAKLANLFSEIKPAVLQVRPLPVSSFIAPACFSQDVYDSCSKVRIYFATPMLSYNNEPMNTSSSSAPAMAILW